MKEKEINFEEAMKSLEEIASTLEKGELGLDAPVSKFEEGMKLSKQCNDMLEAAEKRISILIEEEGEIVEQKFKRSEE